MTDDLDRVPARSTRIAILGAGLMGAEIAALCAVVGFDVVATVSPATSAAMVAERVDRAIPGTGPMVNVASSSATACEGASVVLECLPEDLEFKHRELRIAQRVAPAALLATNTSSLSVTRVAEGLDAPERLVGIHFLNPPTLFDVVEVIPGVDQSMTGPAAEFVRSIRKEPLVLGRDVPGFLINRLQMAMLRECVYLVDEGVASAEDIDFLMEAGLARRWTALGPFATASLGGATLFETIAREVYPSLAANVAPVNGVARRTFNDEETSALRAGRVGKLKRIRAAIDGSPT